MAVWLDRLLSCSATALWQGKQLCQVFELASKVPKQEKSTTRKLRLNTFVWYPINFLNRTPYLSLKLVYLLAYVYNLNISGLSEGLRNGTYLQNLQRWLGGEGWPRIESLEAVGSGDRPPRSFIYYITELLCFEVFDPANFPCLEYAVC